MAASLHIFRRFPDLFTLTRKAGSFTATLSKHMKRIGYFYSLDQERVEWDSETRGMLCRQQRSTSPPRLKDKPIFVLTGDRR